MEGRIVVMKNTIEKAYGNVPKEPMPIYDLSWIPTYRGIRYYLIKMIRFITR